MLKNFSSMDVRALWKSIYENGYVKRDSGIDDVDNLTNSLNKLYAVSGTKNLVPAEGFDYSVCYNIVWFITSMSQEFIMKWVGVLNCIYGMIGSTTWVYMPTLVLKNKLIDDAPPASNWDIDNLDNRKGCFQNENIKNLFISEDLVPRFVEYKHLNNGFFGVPLVHSDMHYEDLPGNEWGFIDEFEIKEAEDILSN